MTSSRITRCPKCQTSFKVTQAQLRAASGSVRCGSCLEVFDARSQMNSDPAPEKKLQTQATEKQTSKATKTPEQSPSQDNKPEINTTKTTEPSGKEEHQFHSFLETLDKEHVEVDEEQRRSSLKLLGWTALILLASLTLVGQYAWFNKDQLSLDPRLRPAYTLSCQYLNCSLPALVDAKAIKSLQLHIRSHPEQDTGLVVDSVIINEATFPQPWPQLELTFTDINGQPVASRRFRPREYLGGALAGSREMPSGQPIRLSIEIVDPGNGATNYQLRFLPIKQS
ncbi:DUF3426 domain-containing protein [Endozoicomonas numazuensis]|uniref:Zinc finger/thioredoxin putative domain-containing protein n=1 Tax=Endozoicomonas numazuensis TaxID=1137799 RepID=A0A081NKE8_9GAMM|nr:DUF3426 domain-containing protein [Endozoicomonas numazuensis]KEQ18921.1 hypothetical protein GZ78_02390 [Endozoicomonas numazuensis]